MKVKPVRAASPASQQRSALQSFLIGGSTDLTVPGYVRLIDSPDVSSAIGKVADIVSSATIQLWRNTDRGDVRVIERRQVLAELVAVPPDRPEHVRPSRRGQLDAAVQRLAPADGHDPRHSRRDRPRNLCGDLIRRPFKMAVSIEKFAHAQSAHMMKRAFVIDMFVIYHFPKHASNPEPPW